MKDKISKNHLFPNALDIKVPLWIAEAACSQCLEKLTTITFLTILFL